MTFAPSRAGILQRKCACGQHTGGGECEECRKKDGSAAGYGSLQRKPSSTRSAPTVPPIVHEVLRSPGQPLDAATRSFFEPRFGYDFSRVRVHTDGRAAESARAVHSVAYTFGHDIAFDTGLFAPSRKEGRHLLAHELAHVMQQGGAQGALLQRQVDEGELVASADDKSEKKADNAADAVTSEEQGEPADAPTKSHSKKKIASCDRNILAEGTCADLVAKSRFICCDSENGITREGKKKDIDGKACPDEKFTPIFTCDSTCKKALERGCSDTDNWMAIPGDKFKRSMCDDVFTICANGMKTTGYVRDKSETASSFEVSPAIQTALGVSVGSSFMGAIYRPGAKQATIEKDPCCNS